MQTTSRSESLNKEIITRAVTVVRSPRNLFAILRLGIVLTIIEALFFLSLYIAVGLWVVLFILYIKADPDISILASLHLPILSIFVLYLGSISFWSAAISSFWEQQILQHSNKTSTFRVLAFLDPENASRISHLVVLMTLQGVFMYLIFIISSLPDFPVFLMIIAFVTLWTTTLCFSATQVAHPVTYKRIFTLMIGLWKHSWMQILVTFGIFIGVIAAMILLAPWTMTGVGDTPYFLILLYYLVWQPFVLAGMMLFFLVMHVSSQQLSSPTAPAPPA